MAVEFVQGELEVVQDGTRLDAYAPYTHPPQRLAVNVVDSSAVLARNLSVKLPSAAARAVRANLAAHVPEPLLYLAEARARAHPRLLCALQILPFRAEPRVHTRSSAHIGEIARSVCALSVSVRRTAGRSESSSAKIALAACK